MGRLGPSRILFQFRPRPVDEHFRGDLSSPFGHTGGRLLGRLGRLRVLRLDRVFARSGTEDGLFLPVHRRDVVVQRGMAGRRRMHDARRLAGSR
jgi:hypothetical protein